MTTNHRLEASASLRLPVHRVTEASAAGMVGCLAAALALAGSCATSFLAQGPDLYGQLAPHLSKSLPMPTGLARVALNASAYVLAGIVIMVGVTALVSLFMPSVKVELDERGVRLRRGKHVLQGIEWSRPFTVTRTCHVEPRVPSRWRRAKPHLVLELRQGGEPMFLWRAARPGERDEIVALPHWGDEIPPLSGHLGDDETARRIMGEVMRRVCSAEE